MPVAVLEKASFVIPAVALFVQGRLAREVFLASLYDLTLGILFVVAYVRARPRP